MMDKKLAYIQNEVIALKYDFKKKQTVIGGFKRTMTLMETFMLEFFELSYVPEPAFPQTNKLKYSFKCSRVRFVNALKELEQQGVVIESTRSHGRLMR